jgi:two-component system sensor histidine kinase ArlS
MGSMKNKLLDKTLRVYILFSVIVLVISAPLFYFLADKLFIDDADEALLLRKNEFIINTLPSLLPADITVWNRFNRDIKIEESQDGIIRDSIFYRFYLDTLVNENEPYRVLQSPVKIGGKPYAFMARINLVESEDMIKGIALLFIAILGTLLIGLYFITRRLSKRIWKPFYSTLEQVEQFELDKNTLSNFSYTDIEEFSRLNQSVSKLLERNVTIYKSQKEFIENASHELQTPLAAFQAKLDTLAQQLPFTNELGKTLSDLNDSVSRLNRINRNLLLLSRIENNQYATLEEISIGEILKKQIAFFAEQAEESNIRLQLKYTEPCIKKANASLLEISISNLLLNALRHNHQNGKIVISLYKDTLSVSNTGASSALDKEKLFQRFTQPGSSGGTGLGLAIVKKIIDLHQWKIDYHFADGRHHFKVSFL